MGRCSAARIPAGRRIVPRGMRQQKAELKTRILSRIRAELLKRLVCRYGLGLPAIGPSIGFVWRLHIVLTKCTNQLYKTVRIFITENANVFCHLIVTRSAAEQ